MFSGGDLTEPIREGYEGPEEREWEPLPDRIPGEPRKYTHPTSLPEELPTVDACIGEIALIHHAWFEAWRDQVPQADALRKQLYPTTEAYVHRAIELDREARATGGGSGSPDPTTPAESQPPQP